MPETFPWAESLARLESKIDQLIEDVNAPPRHGEPGGLLVRQGKSEEALERLARALDDVMRRLELIESTPGKTALTWWDRVGLALLMTLLTGVSGLVGATLTRGGTH